jgi:glycerol dehydrogenase
MHTVFASPLRYTQGPGVTATLGQEMAGLGLRGPVCILAGKSARRDLESTWAATFGAVNMPYGVYAFGGECSVPEIARARAAAEAIGAQVIVAAGGGKALDTGRAVAAELSVPAVICPTIASTDSPCSAISVIYTESGEVESARKHDRNPALVLVDSSVIAAAPLRMLVAGMGDALSTWFEARACIRSGARNMGGGACTHAVAAIAELCWRTLQEDGVAAVQAMKSPGPVPAPALERIIEANTLLSGLGFESAGLAGAHSVHNGLCEASEVHAYLHGEKVAFGTLCQLVLEQAPAEEIAQVLAFCRSVGLPTTLEAIGLANLDDAMLARIAARSVIPGEWIHNEPFPVTADMVASAIREADRIGRQRA